MTSAPSQARSWVHEVPASNWVRSTTRMPLSAFIDSSFRSHAAWGTESFEAHYFRYHLTWFATAVMGSPSGVASTKCSPHFSATSTYPSIAPVSLSSFTSHPGDAVGRSRGCTEAHREPPATWTEYVLPMGNSSRYLPSR